MDEELQQLEAELKRLRPAAPSAALESKIARELAVAAPTPARSRWLWWGALPAAAAVAILATASLRRDFAGRKSDSAPVAESAAELARLMQEGKARAIGASNCTVEQLAEFASACPLAAVQPAYNMLQREIEQDLVPWCVAQGVAIVVYWPLLKGLLAGKLARDHVFAAGDGRAKYPMFQGDEKAFCDAYGSGNYAPDLLVPRHP